MLHARATGTGDTQMGMLPGGVLTPIKIPPELLNELLDACPSTAGVINAGSMLAGHP